MSTWDLIEETLQRMPVSIKLERREAFVVKEALSLMIREMIESKSAWAVLENWGLMNEEEQPASVTGLTKQEAELIKQATGATSKSGNSGEVMQLTPKTWLDLAKKIDANEQYFDSLLAGVSTARQLSDKIRAKMRLYAGENPASQPPEKVKSPDDLNGNPGDAPDVVHGSAAHGNALGWDTMKSASPEKLDISKTGRNVPSSKSKVHAQDMAGMKGSSKSVATVHDPKTQKKTDDMEDPSRWFEGRRR